MSDVGVQLADWNVPAPHDEQSVHCPLAETNCPGEHAETQSWAPKESTWPLGHVRHDAADAHVAQEGSHASFREAEV